MIRKIIPILFVMALFNGCDKVEAPYLEPNNSNNAVVNYYGDDSVSIDNHLFVFTDATTPVYKKVLMEEFTGHSCGNCPPAGLFLNQTLQPQYGDSLVVISIHAGSFAEPTSSLPNQPAGSFLSDHRCAAGNDWFVKFNVSFFPSGMVDQKGFPNSHLKPYTSWNTAILGRLAVTPAYRLSVKAEYDSTSRNAFVAVQATSLGNAIDTLKLQLAVTEDSVIDWQEWYGHTPEYVPDFIHRHMLRGTITSSVGEVVYSGAISSGDKRIRGYSYSIKPEWNSKHCHVVAFITDAVTEEVLQVEEVSLQQ